MILIRKSEFRSLRRLCFSLIGFFVLLSCTKTAKDTATSVAGKDKAGVSETTPVDDTKTQVKSTEGPNARQVCTRPKTITSDPRTIEDVIRLLNEMPKPVSVACLIDVLERPFYLNATSNPFSGQPATSSKSPRIFLFVGPALIISVVPTGAGAEVVEFGYKTDETHSIKAELKFPVTETLALDAAYVSILEKTNDSTLCRACHSPEEAVTDPAIAPGAFVSRYVKAIEDYNVTLKSLEKFNVTCKTDVLPECTLIQSIFFQGQVQARDF